MLRAKRNLDIGTPDQLTTAAGVAPSERQTDLFPGALQLLNPANEVTAERFAPPAGR